MAVNSRAKGARGERDFRNFLRVTYNDGEARRGQQRKGGEDSPDVDSPFLKMLKIHPEVKFMEKSKLTERTMLAVWLAQARKDAGDDLFPVVFHRWNGSRRWWAIYASDYGSTVIMDAEEFLDERWQQHKEQKHET